MKKFMILKSLIIFALLLSSCNKDDDNNGDQDCIKDENFFEAQFDGQTMEPFYVQGGGFGLYTLNLQRCSPADNSWILSINTENGLNLYLYLVDIMEIGNYSTTIGDPGHTSISCAEVTSLFIEDEASNTYTYISSSNGTIEVTAYDSGYGILVGTFTAEMVSSVDPAVKKTITGEFNLNKSTLDNTKRPCWL